ALIDRAPEAGVIAKASPATTRAGTLGRAARTGHVAPRGTRRGPGPRTPAAGSCREGLLRSQQDRGPAGGDEAREGRGEEGDRQREADRVDRQGEDHEVREAEERREGDDRVGQQDAERRAENGPGQG